MPHPVRTLALLREDGLKRLRLSKPNWCALTSNLSAANAVKLLTDRQFDVLVLDLVSMRHDALDAVTIAAVDAGVGVLLYTTLERESLDAILHVFGRVTADLLLMGVDDEVKRLERCLATVAQPSAPALFLHEVAARMRPLSQGLQMRLIGELGWMEIPSTVAEFFGTRDHGESTWRRELSRAGFATPHVLLQCVQLLRTWDALAAGERAGAIAERFGYSSEKELRRRLRRYTRCSPREVRAELAIEEFGRRIVASATRDHGEKKSR